MNDDSMSSASTIRCEHRGPAFWIVLNRPHALNSLNPKLIDEVGRALDHALSIDVRCIVFSAEGRAFSAGGDLKTLQSDPGGALDYIATIGRLFRRIEELPLPTVAAVNGLALAGGLELVLCCDLVLACEEATFGDGHARYGLLPGGGASVRLPRKLGPNRANELMMRGEPLSAARMYEWGLVNEVVRAGELHAAVDRAAAGFARQSPLALARLKGLLRTGASMSVPQALEAERLMCALQYGSADCREGLAAFAGKREPVFAPRRDLE
jgi:enoyl-CoA hydratase/carnithine racemase